jgi:Sigma-70 region 2
MRRDSGETDERFAAYVRDRGDHHLRLAVLLTGDWHAAEDLVQTSLIKLYRAWPRVETTEEPDANLRRIMINTHRSWWRARWRRETPTATPPEDSTTDDIAERQAISAVVRQALAKLPRSSEPCWCCGTPPTSPKPRSPNSSAVPPARSRPTRTAGCAHCASHWAATSHSSRSTSRSTSRATSGEGA